jgi:ABC-2 type transport system permease protein
VLRRELRRILERRALYALLVLVLPLLVFGVLHATFASAVPRDLPLVFLDEDRSALSRRLERAVDATASLAVAHHAVNLDEARRLVLQGRAYGVIVAPAGLQRDAARGEASPALALPNSAYLLPAAIVRRDARAAAGTLSSGVELRRRAGRGEPAVLARARLEPLPGDRRALHNPALNYSDFLLPPLFATVLHALVIVATVQAVGSELRDGTAGAWLDAAGGRLGFALAGKLLPLGTVYAIVGLLALGFLHGVASVPLRGSAFLLVASLLLLVAAGQAIAVLVTAWAANLRLASSAAAFYAGPALAFSGVTFPTIGMPVLARGWGALLPLTYQIRIGVEQGIRGAALSASLPDLAALAAFPVVALGLSWHRLSRVAREPRFWGRT